MESKAAEEANEICMSAGMSQRAEEKSRKTDGLIPLKLSPARLTRGYDWRQASIFITLELYSLFFPRACTKQSLRDRFMKMPAQRGHEDAAVLSYHIHSFRLIVLRMWAIIIIARATPERNVMNCRNDSRRKASERNARGRRKTA